MAFALHRREPLGPGIARVFQREAKKAARSGRAGNIPATVHELRRRMKKMRALLRLVRCAIGEERFLTENARLRGIGLQLSEMRDAEVRLRTLDEVLERDFQDKHRFRAHRHELARGAALCTHAAGELLTELIFSQPEPLPLGGLRSAAICEALEKTYRRTRKALRNAHEKQSVEHFHELRKRAKDLWYDLRLLQCAFPDVLKPQARQFKRLTKLLGEHLDLTLLLATIPKSAADFKPLSLGIKTRQIRLKRASLDFADLCLAEKPKHFAARVGTYFPNDRCGSA